MSKNGEIIYPAYYLQLDATPVSHAALEFIRDVGLRSVVDAYHPRENKLYPHEIPSLEFMDQSRVVERVSGWKQITKRFPETPIRPELAELAAQSNLRQIRLVASGE